MDLASIVDVIRMVGNRFRIKLRDETEPEPWGKWLTVPVAGYLEAASCGPWPWQAIEWVEVEPSLVNAGKAVNAFREAEILASEVDGNIRVTFDRET